jgi:predicted KAP-like P-loop ATPase
MAKLIADQPIIGNLEGRADSIYQVVVELMKEEKNLRAFAIYGAWGSGKTSICYNIYEHFRLSITESKPVDESYIIPVWFDAWRYQHEYKIFPALLKTIGSTLKEVIKNDSAQALGNKLMIITKSLIGGFKVKALGIEYDPKNTLDQYDKELEKADESLVTQAAMVGESPYFKAYEILKKISNEIKLDGKRIRILIFIDDLDRCLPDVAFKVIEQIKIWFDIEGYTICMALHEDEIKKVVTKHLKTSLAISPIDSKKMAEDYLLKVLPLGIYINKYHHKLDKDKTEIFKLIEPDKSFKDTILSQKDSDPFEILSVLKEKNSVEFKFPFRKLITFSNEIYVENLILEKLNNKEGT